METKIAPETSSLSYELSYLLDPALKEDDILKIADSVKGAIEASAGFILEEERARLQKLGYPINDKPEAYFGWLKFLGKPETLEKTKTAVNGIDGILRTFLVKVEREETSKGLVLKKRKTVAPQEVEIKELDKKLEEILGNVT